MNNISTPQEPEKDNTSNNNQIPRFKIPSYIIEGAKTIKSSYRYQPQKEIFVVRESSIDELHERTTREETGRDGDRPLDKE